MKHITSTAQSSLALAGTVLVGLALAGPAAARPDSGMRDVGTSAPTLPYSQEAYENHYLPPSPEPASPVVLRVDDNAIEVVQLGAGLLAGVALAGVGVAVSSRRTHGQLAHPA
jgi:hypothetical protein